MSAGEPKGDFVRRSSFDFAPDPARSRRVGPGRYSGPTRFSKFVTKGSGSVQAVRKLRRRLRPYPTRPIVPIAATRRLEGSGTVGVTCPIDDGGPSKEKKVLCPVTSPPMKFAVPVENKGSIPVKYVSGPP